jgi:ribose-phosphate pyrophosphokinase
LQESPIVELVTTNTIQQREWGNEAQVTVLSVADLLAEAIIRIHNGQSVSSLFEIEK